MQNNQAEDVLVVLTAKLNGLSSSPSERCIFRVHNHLRELNEKAYEPELVSIGPYHRGKEKLQMMEEQKLCYLRLVLQRKNEDLTKYVSAMRSLEEEARKCYAEPVELGKDEFLEMLLLDSCFVVELMRKYEMAHLQEEDDIIFKMDWLTYSLRRDLMLFENQLPFVVVRKMFGLIEEKMNNLHFLIYLSLRFFRGLLDKSVAPQALGESDSSIKHLLELVHDGVLPFYLRQRTNVKAAKMKECLYMPCASNLVEAGVKIEKLEEGNLFDITFKNGVMSIPPLRMEDRTESVFRNLIAFEQYSDENCYKIVTEYASFMDRLIDTPKDVEILSTRGIVDNWLGDDEAISSMFNKILLCTVSSRNFIYADVCNKVNIYCNRRMNRWMAKLKRNYLNSPWAIISVIAAVVLLLLTLTQTVTSITMK